MTLKIYFDASSFFNLLFSDKEADNLSVDLLSKNKDKLNLLFSDWTLAECRRRIFEMEYAHKLFSEKWRYPYIKNEVKYLKHLTPEQSSVLTKKSEDILLGRLAEMKAKLNINRIETVLNKDNLLRISDLSATTNSSAADMIHVYLAMDNDIDYLMSDDEPLNRACNRLKKSGSIKFTNIKFTHQVIKLNLLSKKS
jgi:predicted nucleic acid-binding protein